MTPGHRPTMLDNLICKTPPRVVDVNFEGLHPAFNCVGGGGGGMHVRAALEGMVERWSRSLDH